MCCMNWLVYKPGKMVDTVMAHEASSPRRVSLRDIARQLKISAATVSRALRDDRRISEPVRRKVREVAEAMGYRPDPMLSALSHYRRSKSDISIGAELAWINYWPEPKRLRSFKEFELYWRGAFEESQQSGFRLEEFFLSGEMTPARLERILLARNIQGILIPPHGGLKLDWGYFKWSNFCVVRFGYTIEDPAAHIVTSSQLTEGLIAFKNMWGLGYRRIGLAVVPRALTRFGAGYLFAQWQQNPKMKVPPLVFEHGAQEEKKLAVLKAWIHKHEPDAILTDMGAMRGMLKKIGYSVPQDLGLAAFSVLDGEAAAGIDQQSKEIGRAAVQLLISLINHNERGIPAICREVLIGGRWIDGDTLPPKG
jgi:LacI family transcriptional regulator